MQIIDIGLAPTDGRGESLREGGQKINANFQEVDQRLVQLEQSGVGMEFVSLDPNNRLKRGADGGLYVSDEFLPDPLVHYILSKG